MEKKLMCLILIACVLLCAVLPVQQAEASDLAFISTNDKLLELSSSPYYTDGIYYAPYWVFATFGISYSYLSEVSTATLYSGQVVCSFNMANGGSFDGNGTEYTYSAVFRAGAVYVPIKHVCDLFGLSFSYINGGDRGDILRIQNGSAVLSDRAFLSAASPLMEFRQNQYTEENESTSVPETQQTAAPTPTPSPSIPQKDVFLSFSGLPAVAVLDTLDKNGDKASIFLSAEDVRSNPDMVRRISGSGHKLGVLLGETNCEETFDEVSELLFEAAKVCTVMISSNSGDAAATFAEKRGLSYKTADIIVSGDISSLSRALEGSDQRASVRVICDDSAPDLPSEVLNLLSGGSYILRPLLEGGF